MTPLATARHRDATARGERPEEQPSRSTRYYAERAALASMLKDYGVLTLLWLLPVYVRARRGSDALPGPVEAVRGRLRPPGGLGVEPPAPSGDAPPADPGPIRPLGGRSQDPAVHGVHVPSPQVVRAGRGVPGRGSGGVRRRGARASAAPARGLGGGGPSGAARVDPGDRARGARGAAVRRSRGAFGRGARRVPGRPRRLLPRVRLRRPNHGARRRPAGQSRARRSRAPGRGWRSGAPRSRRRSCSARCPPSPGSRCTGRWRARPARRPRPWWPRPRTCSPRRCSGASPRGGSRCLVVLAVLPLAWDRIDAAFARRAPERPFRFGVGLGVALSIGAAFAPAIVLPVGLFALVNLVAGRRRDRGSALVALAALVGGAARVPGRDRGVGRPGVGAHLRDRDDGPVVPAPARARDGAGHLGRRGVPADRGDRVLRRRGGSAARPRVASAGRGGLGDAPRVGVGSRAVCRRRSPTRRRGSRRPPSPRARSSRTGSRRSARGWSGRRSVLASSGWRSWRSCCRSASPRRRSRSRSPSGRCGPAGLPPAWPVIASTAQGPFRILWLGEPDGDRFPAPGGDPISLAEAGDRTVRFGLTDRDGVSALDEGRARSGSGYDELHAVLERLLAGGTRHAGRVARTVRCPVRDRRGGRSPAGRRGTPDRAARSGPAPGGRADDLPQRGRPADRVRLGQRARARSRRPGGRRGVARRDRARARRRRRDLHGDRRCAGHTSWSTQQFDAGWRVENGGEVLAPFAGYGWAIAAPVQAGSGRRPLHRPVAPNGRALPARAPVGRRPVGDAEAGVRVRKLQPLVALLVPVALLAGAAYADRDDTPRTFDAGDRGACDLGRVVLPARRRTGGVGGPAAGREPGGAERHDPGPGP